MDATQTTEILKLLIAVLLGGILGYEREVQDKPAGLRTHMLTAVASTLLVILAVDSVSYFNAQSEVQMQIDPLRIFQAIVVGVSFVGAGTILKRREDNVVRNLSTAASILATSAVGIGIALEKYLLAGVATVLVAAINFGVGLLKEKTATDSVRIRGGGESESAGGG